MTRIIGTAFTWALVANCALSQELSRGNAILLERGLQIQAIVFSELEEPMNPVVGFNYDLWKQSNFTTINWQYHSEAAFELPSGTVPVEQAWGRWAGSPSLDDLTPSANQLPYDGSLVSFQFMDEQDISDPQQVERARQWLEAARQRYPDAISYTNQSASLSDANVLRNYMSIANPDMIMFDLYPFDGKVTENLRSPAGFYSHLQIYRQLGLGGNDGTGNQSIPYGLYTQAAPVGTAMHQVSDSEMRLNQFSAWAFGYKFITAYTYNASSYSAGSVLFDGVGDTNPTARFYKMAEINRQSSNLSPALVRLQSTDIRFIGGQYRDAFGNLQTNPVPAGIDPWSVGGDPYITSITATNLGPQNDGLPGDVLIGYFKPMLESFDGPDFQDQIYFMIVNGLVDPSLAADVRQSIRISFDFHTSGITSLQRLSRSTGQVEIVPLMADGGSLYHLDLVLDGGVGDLFKFNSGAPFVVAESPSKTLLLQLISIAGVFHALVICRRKLRFHRCT